MTSRSMSDEAYSSLFEDSFCDFPLTSLQVRRLEIPGVEHLHPQVLVQHLAAHGDAAQVGRVHEHVVVVVVVAADVV